MLFSFPAYAQDAPHGTIDASWLKGARAEGSFVLLDGGQGIHQIKPGQLENGFWQPAISTTYDGTLRAVCAMGKRPDFSLFFRASFPEKMKDVSGYSVSIKRERVTVHRWEAGHPVEIVNRIKLKSLPSRIEIEVKMSGPQIEVSVKDAASHDTLASFALFDAAFSGTATGLRQNRRQDSKSALMALDFEPAAHASTPPNWTDPDAFVRQHPQNYVIVPHEALATVSKTLSSCKLIHEKLIPDHTLYRCDARTIGSLLDLRTGVPKYGIKVAEHRLAFENGPWQKTVQAMKCKTPMHCDPSAPLDPNRSQKDPDMISAYLNAYESVCAKKIKHVKLRTIGHSALGLPIQSLTLTNVDEGKPHPRVFFNAAHHGMELLSTDFAFDIIESLCENPRNDARYQTWLDHLEVNIVPIVNPDGADLYFHASKQLGRKNGQDVFGAADGAPSWPARYDTQNRKGAYFRYHANRIRAGAGVDVNRNYPIYFAKYGEKASSSDPRSYYYRGPSAGSEPEIKAMMKLVTSEQFVASISYHTVSTKILAPYSIDDLKNPPHEQDFAWKLAERMAAKAGVQASKKPYAVVNNIYAVDGTDQDWFRFHAGTYAYLVEGALHNPTGKAQRDAIERNRPTWETLLEAAMSSVIIQVTDNGVPVSAEIDISLAPRLNGEVWKTRQSDGTFATLCEPNATITTTVTFKDGNAVSKQTTCTTEPQLVTYERNAP